MGQRKKLEEDSGNAVHCISLHEEPIGMENVHLFVCNLRHPIRLCMSSLSWRVSEYVLLLFFQVNFVVVTPFSFFYHSFSLCFVTCYPAAAVVQLLASLLPPISIVEQRKGEMDDADRLYNCYTTFAPSSWRGEHALWLVWRGGSDRYACPQSLCESPHSPTASWL